MHSVKRQCFLTNYKILIWIEGCKAFDSPSTGQATAISKISFRLLPWLTVKNNPTSPQDTKLLPGRIQTWNMNWLQMMTKIFKAGCLSTLPILINPLTRPCKMILQFFMTLRIKQPLLTVIIKLLLSMVNVVISGKETLRA